MSGKVLRNLRFKCDTPKGEAYQLRRPLLSTDWMSNGSGGPYAYHARTPVPGLPVLISVASGKSNSRCSQPGDHCYGPLTCTVGGNACPAWNRASRPPRYAPLGNCWRASGRNPLP